MRDCAADHDRPVDRRRSPARGLVLSVATSISRMPPCAGQRKLLRLEMLAVDVSGRLHGRARRHALELGAARPRRS